MARPRGGIDHKPPLTELQIAAKKAQAAFEAVEPRRVDAKKALGRAEELLLAYENSILLPHIHAKARDYQEELRTGTQATIDAKFQALCEVCPDDKWIRNDQRINIPSWIRNLVAASTDWLNAKPTGDLTRQWARKRAAILAAAENKTPPLEAA
jgi:hypothetical protein